MNDIIIMVDKNAMAYKKCLFQKLGNEQQNLQNKLKFEFEDEIVEGQAWLEFEIDGVKKFTSMEKYELGYQIDIKNCLLTSSQVSVDLKITQDEEHDGVPVFITNIITFDVEQTINAEKELIENYPDFVSEAKKVIDKIELTGDGNKYLSDDGTYKTISEISGGLNDYNQLNNKPQINNVELSNNKTLESLGIQSKMDKITNTELDDLFSDL